MKRTLCNNPFIPERITLGSLSIDWQNPVLMGIVNVTPDSFYDGGKWTTTDAAVAHALELARHGAHILDIGGESTRPGSDPVPADEEIRRTRPVVEELASRGLVVSIDTMKSQVAEAALEAGALIVNDVTGGLHDPAIREVAARYGAVYIVGHIRGTPKTMQKDVHYGDLYAEVTEELSRRVDEALEAGIQRARLWLDPGIGFGKTAEQSALLNTMAGRMAEELELPVLIGPSNKSFIGHITGADKDDRLPGTIAACIAGWMAGAHVFRVHDVRSLNQALAIYGAALHD